MLRFRIIRRLGPWAPLTSNPSIALSAVLKTGVRCGLGLREGIQGGRERSGDVRGCRGQAGESPGDEHVRAILKALARAWLERGATVLILRPNGFLPC